MELKTFFQNIETVANLAKAINNPVRKKMIHYLLDHPSTPVSKLAKRIKQPPSVTSLHLAILRSAGLVQSQRNGRNISYSVTEKRLKQLEAAAGKLAGR